MFSSCKIGEQCVSPGLYAIAGAASALAGVTRLTGIRAEIVTNDSLIGCHYVRVDRGFTFRAADHDFCDAGKTGRGYVRQTRDL